jgi:hypothetical protein
MSREHYVSESVLRAIDGGGKTIEVRGLPRQPNDTSQRISTAALTGRVLCERHNGALSELDTAALNFVRIAEQIHEGFNSGVDEEFIVDGDQFERWMLKVLCGFLASQNMVNQRGQRIRDWNPPRHWLDSLFKRCPFGTDNGLWVCGAQGRVSRHLLRFSPLWGADQQTSIGLRMWLFEDEYVLVMDESVRYASERLLDNAMHRPGCIVYRDPSCSKRLTFHWQQPVQSGVLEIERRPD